MVISEECVTMQISPHFIWQLVYSTSICSFFKWKHLRFIWKETSVSSWKLCNDIIIGQINEMFRAIWKALYDLFRTSLQPVSTHSHLCSRTIALWASLVVHIDCVVLLSTWMCLFWYDCWFVGTNKGIRTKNQSEHHAWDGEILALLANKTNKQTNKIGK